MCIKPALALMRKKSIKICKTNHQPRLFIFSMLQTRLCYEKTPNIKITLETFFLLRRITYHSSALSAPEVALSYSENNSFTYYIIMYAHVYDKN